MRRRHGERPALRDDGDEDDLEEDREEDGRGARAMGRLQRIRG
jgi:hypothetical protein